MYAHHSARLLLLLAIAPPLIALACGAPESRNGSSAINSMNPDDDSVTDQTGGAGGSVRGGSLGQTPDAGPSSIDVAIDGTVVAGGTGGASLNGQGGSPGMTTGDAMSSAGGGQGGGPTTPVLPPAGTNLLTNPGFEDGTTGWFKENGSGSSSSPGRTGSFSLTEPRPNEWWWQDIAIVQPGKTYTFSAWARSPAGGCLLGVSGSRGPMGEAFHFESTGAGVEWTHLTLHMWCRRISGGCKSC